MLLLIAFFLLQPNSSIDSSTNNNLSCIKPSYFNQNKWVNDTIGKTGYKSSVMQEIASDSALIGRSKLYIQCVFRGPYSIDRGNNGYTFLSYQWFSRGYDCSVIFKLKRNKVVKIHHFKGCG
ncbi:MAG: hypothetical protein COA58_02310 [Bacteroidetes bacterium]|nr:MAG: hypothetical protein COA58_02310 [Bacteroidota bacterium]